MEETGFQLHSDELPGEVHLAVSGELDLSAAPRVEFNIKLWFVWFGPASFPRGICD